MILGEVDTLDFLGNKSGMLEQLDTAIKSRLSPNSQVLDLFSGTGAVAQYLADSGHTVHANDMLPLAVTWARTRLMVTDKPTFAGVAELAAFKQADRYAAALTYLNALPPVRGWVTESFTPASIESTPFERRYFTEANGMRIDAIRNQLLRWKNALPLPEWSLLMSSLLEGVSAVSNIAGTYGSYLKEYKPRALESIKLTALPLPNRTPKAHSVTEGDAAIAVASSDATLVYADPPYTKRQYAAYYHVLNSIAGTDNPRLIGKTGLPDWRQWSSDWCYSTKAPLALDRLVRATKAPILVLSYSSDGHIPHDAILQILGARGQVSYSETERRRFRSSSKVHKSATVLERIYVMEK